MLQKVTDIQPQKKREGYYSIFVDDQYSFSLSELDLSVAKLHIGDQINKDRLLELQKLSQQSKMYSRAIYYLRFGPRTVWQMQEYLVRKANFDPEEIMPVLQRLQSDGYLDDKAYIDAYINSRQLSRPRSKRQLQAELMKKGIGSTLIHSSLEKLDNKSQKDAAAKIVRKKKQISRFQDEQKLTEYMLRQGFPDALVKEVLAEVNSETS